MRFLSAYGVAKSSADKQRTHINKLLNGMMKHRWRLDYKVTKLVYGTKHILLQQINRRIPRNCHNHVTSRPKAPCRPRWLSWTRRPTGDQEVAGSTPAEVGNILSWRLIMKYFLRSFSPFRWFKKGSCQFLAKECAKYWLTAKRTKPAQYTCGYVNWPCSTWPHWVDWAVKPQHKQTPKAPETHF